MTALSEPGAALAGGWAEGRSPLGRAINLLSLALLVWGVSGEAHPGLSGRHLAALLLLVSAAGAWVSWLVARRRPAVAGTTVTRPSRVGPSTEVGALLVMGVAGGVLTLYAPLGLVFVGVSALSASITWPLRDVAWLLLSGPVSMAVALSVAGHRLSLLPAGLAAAVAGSAMGLSRRQSLESQAEAARVQVGEARAEAERARAELLEGRNHLARELHDVLAHTLSALSLQLEALDAMITREHEKSPQLQEQVDTARRLVREGLDEARGAVRVLREDLPPLDEQLERLADGDRARLSISGAPRALAADVSLALYRVAQEALTNVTKHAPGSDVLLRLDFRPGTVVLSVTNGAPPDGVASGLASTGGGYGLQGIRERILLLGGTVEAGPDGGGWVVAAEVPA